MAAASADLDQQRVGRCGRSLPDANCILVATTGHEIGHGGRQFFLCEKAPRPDPRITWAHYCEIEMISRF
jgi:hypothetical protein